MIGACARTSAAKIASEMTSKANRTKIHLREKFGNHAAALIDRHGAAIRRVQFMFGIDAEQRVNRACEVDRRHGIILGAFADAIARTDHLPAANAAASHHDTEHPRPMIAPAALIELRRAAEFAHRDDQRLVEQPAIREVFNERRERHVKRGNQPDALFAPA